MGRLIDEEELEKYIIHDGCEKGCGYIDERDLKYIPTVEAIPKDQYENRLKADIVAVLTELQLEIDELNDSKYFNDGTIMVYTGIRNFKKNMNDLIQQKINALKAESEET